MRRANRNLPPATLLTGGRLGKASDRLGLTIETDPMEDEGLLDEKEAFP